MSTRDVISLISKVREKVNRKIVSLIAEHGIEGLATSHGDIIFALFGRSRLTMAEIAYVIGKDKSTVTALVEKLVKLGYVAKHRDSEDARVIYVTLTDRGWELKPAFEAVSAEVLNAFYQGVSDDERRELIRLLSKIYGNL